MGESFWHNNSLFTHILFELQPIIIVTLESVIDVGQGISIGAGTFRKKNKRRAWKIWKKE